MAVTEQTPRNVSTAAPGATVFPYDFKIIAGTDMLVKVDGVPKTLGVDYTLSGVGLDIGGNVTFIVPMVGGETVVRKREMPFTRETDYQNLGDLRSPTLNNDQDAPVMMIQQLADDLSRALRLPISSTANAELPELVPLMPLVVSADGTSVVIGDTELTGDMLLRGDLASTDASKGATLVFPAIETLGAKGNGVDLDDTAFAAAAALGRTVILRHGATYYLSTGVSSVPGTRFVCPNGYATIKLKTGSGGFNSTDLTADKNAAGRCAFLFSGVDDVGMTGIVFITDGVAERVIYPIRCNGGTTFKGCQFDRIIFSGMSACNGGYLSLNTIGDGRWVARDIQARNCGTALNTWTGTPQITVLEVDNDMIAAVPSYPGDFENIGAYNVLLTGAALTTYGQQTDVINIAGISGTDRKGPTGHGVYADGVGEVVDLFCTGASITGVRARNVHNFVAKFIHGARYNYVEIDHVESCGFAVVTFAGSSALVGHTEYNTCRVISAKGIGDSGTGPTVDVAGVLIQENGGSLATCLPRNNVCDIVNFVGSANTDFAVKDNCTVANANNNLVRFDRLPTGMAAFGTIVNDSNTRVKVQDRQRVEATLTANQTPLTTAVDTTIAFNQVVTDRQAQLNTGTYKVRLKAPGIYRARASVRSGLNTGDDVTLKILKNTTPICQAASEAISGTILHTYAADKVFEVTPSEAGTASADISIVANITSAGTITLTDTDSMTFFEVTPMDG